MNVQAQTNSFLERIIKSAQEDKDIFTDMVRVETDTFAKNALRQKIEVRDIVIQEASNELDRRKGIIHKDKTKGGKHGSKTDPTSGREEKGGIEPLQDGT